MFQHKERRQMKNKKEIGGNSFLKQYYVISSFLKPPSNAACRLISNIFNSIQYVF